MHTYIYYKLITPFKSKENNKYNYVYQITEISTGKSILDHVGQQPSQIKISRSIEVHQKTNNSNQKLNPLDYWYEILSYHETREDATLEEAQLHELYDVGVNDKYLNRCKQTNNGFSTSGKINVKDENGITMQVSVDDERYLNGDLIGATANWLIIEGEVMSSTIAAKRYKVTSYTVRNRVKSTNPKWNDWTLL